MLRFGSAFVVLLVLIFGMSLTTQDADSEIPPELRAIPTTSTTSTTVQDPSTTTSTLADVPEARALVTTTGVVVAVRDQTSRGYHVLDNCGSPVFVTDGMPITEVDVVIDPGHGGEVDTGAVAPTGLVERDLNLDLALVTLAELEARGISTMLTRTSSYTVPLSVRANLADTAQARLMVSIHHNAPTPGVSVVPGTEVFIQSESEESKRLGGLLYEYVVSSLATVNGVVWHAAPDAGVLRVLNTRGEDTYGMMRLPETPTALIEVAYLNSREEAEFLATQEYLDLASVALADAIEAFLISEDPGSGFVDEPRRFTAQPSIARSVCEGVPLG